MVNTTLDGHESCDYSTFDAAEINEAIKGLDEWLTTVRPVIPHAARELTQLIGIEGEQSQMVQTAGRLLGQLLRDMVRSQEARDCLMHEIMNRAHADNELIDKAWSESGYKPKGM